MLPLDHFKHTSNSGTIQASNSFVFMNEPITCEEWLDALSKSLAKYVCMPINFYLGLLEGEACHISGRCINTYLRSQVCSIHSLACKTSSYQVAWLKYHQVNHRCPHSQCKCPLFIDDLLWNDGGHLYALFLNVEPGCWWASQHSHCHIENDTCLNLISKSLKVAFIQSNWAQQLPAEMYSASAVESATLFCFFNDQDTSDLPNSWHLPDVLFLSTLHPA